MPLFFKYLTIFCVHNSTLRDTMMQILQLSVINEMQLDYVVLTRCSSDGSLRQRRTTKFQKGSYYVLSPLESFKRVLQHHSVLDVCVEIMEVKRKNSHCVHSCHNSVFPESHQHHESKLSCTHELLLLWLWPCVLYWALHITTSGMKDWLPICWKMTALCWLVQLRTVISTNSQPYLESLYSRTSQPG